MPVAQLDRALPCEGKRQNKASFSFDMIKQICLDRIMNTA